MRKRYLLIAASAAVVLSMSACGRKQVSLTPETAVSEASSEAETADETEEAGSEAEIDETVIKLEANTPVEIDGKEFTLKVSEPDQDDEVQVSAEYGEKHLDMDPCLSVEGIYLLKTGEETEILVETYTYSDMSLIYLMKVGDGEVSLTDQIEGNLDEEPESAAEGFMIASRVDVLGVYSGIRRYRLQDGKLEAEGNMYQIKNPIDDYTIKLTVAEEINCRLDGGNTTLEPGTEILPEAYSEDGTFYFELEDGTPGNLIVDLNADGTYAGTIGGVDDYELFSDLPYGG